MPRRDAPEKNANLSLPVESLPTQHPRRAPYYKKNEPMGSNNFAYLAGIIDSSKYVEVTPGIFSVFAEKKEVLQPFIDMAEGSIIEHSDYGYTWICPNENKDDLLDCIKDYLRIYKVKP